ncbi:hypothetical protein CTAYLR_002816 [Chrysophaeum taylorii]|uniref:IPT/TIG domain-containing protein n=1 Tax=Chrysophaeum taylorii TaxID=2483200 RepID=A0AAD7U7W7_9STRA|nr:hypothetical protein CTAYLR_002816 [Chrysophaeum taylorii]
MVLSQKDSTPVVVVAKQHEVVLSSGGHVRLLVSSAKPIPHAFLQFRRLRRDRVVLAERLDIAYWNTVEPPPPPPPPLQPKKDDTASFYGVIEATVPAEVISCADDNATKSIEVGVYSTRNIEHGTPRSLCHILLLEGRLDASIVWPHIIQLHGKPSSILVALKKSAGLTPRIVDKVIASTTNVVQLVLLDADGTQLRKLRVAATARTEPPGGVGAVDDAAFYVDAAIAFVPTCSKVRVQLSIDNAEFIDCGDIETMPHFSVICSVPPVLDPDDASNFAVLCSSSSCLASTTPKRQRRRAWPLAFPKEWDLEVSTPEVARAVLPMVPSPPRGAEITLLESIFSPDDLSPHKKNKIRAIRLVVDDVRVYSTPPQSSFWAFELELTATCRGATCSIPLGPIVAASNNNNSEVHHHPPDEKNDDEGYTAAELLTTRDAEQVGGSLRLSNTERLLLDNARDGVEVTLVVKMDPSATRANAKTPSVRAVLATGRAWLDDDDDARDGRANVELAPAHALCGRGAMLRMRLFFEHQQEQLEEDARHDRRRKLAKHVNIYAFRACAVALSSPVSSAEFFSARLCALPQKRGATNSFVCPERYGIVSTRWKLNPHKPEEWYVHESVPDSSRVEYRAPVWVRGNAFKHACGAVIKASFLLENGDVLAQEAYLKDDSAIAFETPAVLEPQMATLSIVFEYGAATIQSNPLPFEFLAIPDLDAVSPRYLPRSTGGTITVHGGDFLSTDVLRAYVYAPRILCRDDDDDDDERSAYAQNALIVAASRNLPSNSTGSLGCASHKSQHLRKKSIAAAFAAAQSVRSSGGSRATAAAAASAAYATVIMDNKHGIEEIDTCVVDAIMSTGGTRTVASAAGQAVLAAMTLSSQKLSSRLSKPQQGRRRSVIHEEEGGAWSKEDQQPSAAAVLPARDVMCQHGNQFAFGVRMESLAVVGTDNASGKELRYLELPVNVLESKKVTFVLPPKLTVERAHVAFSKACGFNNAPVFDKTKSPPTTSRRMSATSATLSRGTLASNASVKSVAAAAANAAAAAAADKNNKMATANLQQQQQQQQQQKRRGDDDAKVLVSFRFASPTTGRVLQRSTVEGTLSRLSSAQVHQESAAGAMAFANLAGTLAQPNPDASHAGNVLPAHDVADCICATSYSSARVGVAAAEHAISAHHDDCVIICKAPPIPATLIAKASSFVANVEVSLSGGNGPFSADNARFEYVRPPTLKSILPAGQQIVPGQTVLTLVGQTLAASRTLCVHLTLLTPPDPGKSQYGQARVLDRFVVPYDVEEVSGDDIGIELSPNGQDWSDRASRKVRLASPYEVTRLEPARGPRGGGTKVTIHGANFPEETNNCLVAFLRPGVSPRRLSKPAMKMKGVSYDVLATTKHSPAALQHATRQIQRVVRGRTFRRLCKYGLPCTCVKATVESPTRITCYAPGVLTEGPAEVVISFDGRNFERAPTDELKALRIGDVLLEGTGLDAKRATVELERASSSSKARLITQQSYNQIFDGRLQLSYEYYVAPDIRAIREVQPPFTDAFDIVGARFKLGSEVMVRFCALDTAQTITVTGEAIEEDLITVVAPTQLANGAEVELSVSMNGGHDYTEALCYSVFKKPILESIRPSCGQISGGSLVEIHGENFLKLTSSNGVKTRFSLDLGDNNPATAHKLCVVPSDVESTSILRLTLPPFEKLINKAKDERVLLLDDDDDDFDEASPQQRREDDEEEEHAKHQQHLRRRRTNTISTVWVDVCTDCCGTCTGKPLRFLLYERVPKMNHMQPRAGPLSGGYKVRVFGVGFLNTNTLAVRLVPLPTAEDLGGGNVDEELTRGRRDREEEEEETSRKESTVEGRPTEIYENTVRPVGVRGTYVSSSEISFVMPWLHQQGQFLVQTSLNSSEFAEPDEQCLFTLYSDHRAHVRDLFPAIHGPEDVATSKNACRLWRELQASRHRPLATSPETMRNNDRARGYYESAADKPHVVRPSLRAILKAIAEEVDEKECVNLAGVADVAREREAPLQGLADHQVPSFDAHPALATRGSSAAATTMMMMTTTSVVSSRFSDSSTGGDVAAVPAWHTKTLVLKLQHLLREDGARGDLLKVLTLAFGHIIGKKKTAAEKQNRRNGLTYGELCEHLMLAIFPSSSQVDLLELWQVADPLKTGFVSLSTLVARLRGKRPTSPTPGPAHYRADPLILKRTTPTGREPMTLDVYEQRRALVIPRVATTTTTPTTT